MGLLLLPGAVVGWYWAKKTQSAYLMGRLFGKLSAQDQSTLIDLVQTLPGTASTG